MDKWFRRIDTLLLLGALSFVLFFVMPAFSESVQFVCCLAL